jgi:hypothetical protein
MSTVNHLAAKMKILNNTHSNIFVIFFIYFFLLDFMKYPVIIFKNSGRTISFNTCILRRNDLRRVLFAGGRW